MIAEKDLLTELDSAIGDGDLGITISRGFRAIESGIDENATSIGQILIKAGLNFINEAGSTMGALLGSALLRAGKSVNDKRELLLDDIYEMFLQSESVIKEKGKAEEGDKTMLDALVPARWKISDFKESSNNILEGLYHASEAAKLGMISTKHMTASAGRARWLGERAIGHQDPGATVVWLMINSVTNTIKELDQVVS